MPYRPLLMSLVIVSWMAFPLSAHALKSDRAIMKTCNEEADARGLTGAEAAARRRTFMKTCLAAKAAEARGATSAASKMKACVKEAGARRLTGQARKTFLSECVK